MNMELKFKIENTDLKNKQLNKLINFLRKERIVEKVATNALALIKSRTLAGVDVNYQTFVPYSTKPIYMPQNHRPRPQGGRRETKTGKKMKTVYYQGGYAEFAAATKKASHPNLFASGMMFKALRVKGLGTFRAKVHFVRKHEAIKAAFNQRKRTFMGINKEKELPVLQGIFDKEIQRAIKKAGL